MTKFMPGPANSTAARFHVFCLYMAYGRSSGAISSIEVMPGDVAEPAQRDGLDAVLGVAQLVGPPRGPQRRAEADEVAAHLHPGGARHPHVPAFVQRHRHQDGQREQRDADDPHHLVVTTSRDTAPLALSRAQRCASSTSSTVAGSAAHWSAACSTSAMVRTIVGNRIRPSRNAAAASSFAAL